MSTREFIAERDARIFEMRRSGLSVAKIAQRFDISTRAVNAAVQRQLEKLNREALLAHPEMLRMELERLDALQQAIWPLTQHRVARLPDGTEVPMEPDLKAVAEVRALMQARAKLLGFEQINLNVVTESTAPDARATLAGAERPAEVSRFDPEQEARQLLEIMGMSGVLPQEMIDQILGSTSALPAAPAPPEPTDDDVTDAEIIYPDEVIP